MGQQKATEKTAVGAYFVSNYPPYSYWCEQQVPEAKAALDQPPVPDTPLGIYLHIPFCRKRCKFCYFRVYTDKPADEIQRYLDGVVRELELYAAKAVAAGRTISCRSSSSLSPCPATHNNLPKQMYNKDGL